MEMRKINLYLIIIISLLFACNNSEQINNTVQENTMQSDGNNVVDNCFLYEKNKDSIAMSINNSEAAISGKLDIIPWEKDARIGNLSNGKMHGDTLFAIYESAQEGERTIAEIAFLKRGNSFILSEDIYSDDNYDLERGVFKDKKSIKFESIELKKVDCKYKFR